MLNPKIQDAINEQINAELYSSYLYLSMSAYFQAHSFDGMAHWMRIQAQEEMGHVMRFYDFVNDRGGRVLLKQVDAPKTEWESPLDAFQDAYAHECKVSGLINDLVGLAQSENDHMTADFLFAIEHIDAVGPVRCLQSGEGRDKRFGAGGDDDFVRFLSLDGVQGCLRIQVNVDIVLAELQLIPGQQTADILFEFRD